MRERREYDRISQQAIEPRIRRVASGSTLFELSFDFGELPLEHLNLSLGVVRAQLHLRSQIGYPIMAANRRSCNGGAKCPLNHESSPGRLPRAVGRFGPRTEHFREVVRMSLV